MTKFGETFKALVADDPELIPDLVARLLADTVERRLRRSLSRLYQPRSMTLTRLRGRIDLLTTASHQLLSKGEIACHFEEPRVNTPRNRLVLTALELMARLLKGNDLGQRCRSLALSLARLGVSRVRPSRSELSADQIGRNDAADRTMIALSLLALNIALPTEEVGPTALYKPGRDEFWVRQLFEKAVLGFARFELEPQGWSVRGGSILDWQLSRASEAAGSILPRMITDIVIDAPIIRERLVIDTKFTSIVNSNRYGAAKLDSGYIYQIYAYLRSQEGKDTLWDTADGMLLHPSIGTTLNERVVIQGHGISFTTLDLTATASSIRAELRSILTQWRRTPTPEPPRWA